MQAILWLVLLATIGLAALVDQHITGGATTTLGPERSSGPLHYRLPAKWDLSVHPQFHPLAKVMALDPDTERGGAPTRAIIIYHQQIRNLTSPDDYLQASGVMEELFGDVEPQTSPAVLAGNPALLLQAESQLQTQQGIVIQSDIALCAIFPNHQAVTIQLSKIGQFTPGDTAILDKVAASVRMDNAQSR